MRDILPSGPDLSGQEAHHDVRHDAGRAHGELIALGLDVGELLDWPTAPLMFSFCDLDGNRLYVSEPG